MKMCNLISIMLTALLTANAMAVLNENFFQGKYKLNDDALHMYIGSTDSKKFGTFTIELRTARSKWIKY